MDTNRQLWIAVDFDGVLVEYDGWQGPTHIGKETRIVGLVRWWLANGVNVAIFTARVSPKNNTHEIGFATITNWSTLMFGAGVVPVTSDKWPKFRFFLDDRAVRVLANEGTFEAPPGLPMPPRSVPELLEEGAALFRERGRDYDGESGATTYQNFGKIACGLFPRGVTVAPGDVEGMNRLALIFTLASKLARYANNPRGHVDSARDAKVYSAMLEQITPHGQP